MFAAMEILHKFDIGNIVTIYKVMNYNTGKRKKATLKVRASKGIARW